MQLVVVPHGAKLTGVGEFPAELASDPPMTMEGKAKMLKLVPELKVFGPFHGTFCSLMDRACGTMCTIVKQLGIKRVICIDELGQMGNLDSDGKVIMYPGHEDDNVLSWQQQGVTALKTIWNKNGDCAMTSLGNKVLVFTHRPIIAGLVASAKSITDAEGIQNLLDWPGLTKNGFVVFNYDGTSLTLVE